MIAATPPPNNSHVEAVRAFNRLITKSLGVLDEDFMGRDRPLGESRVLFEIGRGTETVAELRHRLDLDSGYLSRMLRRLEADDLVQITRDPADGRRRSVSLTRAGREEWTLLDRLSSEHVQDVIAPLGPRRTAELADLILGAHRLFSVATATFERVASTDPAAVYAMTAYFDELDKQFPGGFDPGDWHASSHSAFDGADGAFVLLRCDSQVAGCGGWQTIDEGVGEIKRMWLDPSHRGSGLGRRLLDDLEARVAEHGHHTVRLDTNEVLHTAIAMYERAGYMAVPRYNDNPYATNFFAKRLR